MSNWTLIICCGLITYLTRFTMIALIKKEMFNDRIREILSFVPSAIFPAIIFPAIFINEIGNEIICLDKLTYAGNLNNLKSVKNNDNFKFIKGDICNKDLIDSQ